VRIVLVNTRHFRGGGDSTYTFNLADLLRSKGHEVAFFAMQDPANLPDPNEDLFVSPIDFRRLNRRKTLSGGVRVLSRVLYSREARRKFRLLLQRFQPDLIHLQNILGHISPSVLFEARSQAIPAVWTLHDYRLICPNTHFIDDRTRTICQCCTPRTYYRAIGRRCKKGSAMASLMAAVEAYVLRAMWLPSQVQAFLSPSDFLRSRMLERGFPAERVVHLPLFLPDDAFRAAEGTGDSLLFMGRIEEIKGVIPLLQACAQVPDVKLILAGSVGEPLADRLPGLLPPNAVYVGLKKPQELRALLSHARAVVVPSLWYENQPFGMLEAFAASRPVIASDLGGMKELIERSGAGLLVPPGDVATLAAAMRSMASDPQRARQMGARAHQYAMAAHRPELHYERLMGIYSKAIEGRRRLCQTVDKRGRAGEDVRNQAGPVQTSVGLRQQSLSFSDGL
jgi:glycosyltransferase involved in cell wall biosynthesis